MARGSPTPAPVVHPRDARDMSFHPAGSARDLPSAYRRTRRGILPDATGAAMLYIPCMCVNGLAIGLLLLSLVRVALPGGDGDSLMFIIPALLVCCGGFALARRQNEYAPHRAAVVAALTAPVSFLSLLMVVVLGA